MIRKALGATPRTAHLAAGHNRGFGGFDDRRSIPLIDAGGTFDLFYWIAAGVSYEEVAKLNAHVLERGPQSISTTPRTIGEPGSKERDRSLRPFAEDR